MPKYDLLQWLTSNHLNQSAILGKFALQFRAFNLFPNCNLIHEISYYVHASAKIYNIFKLCMLAIYFKLNGVSLMHNALSIITNNKTLANKIVGESKR